MSFRQFREIRLRDFRCFHERHTARLAPLTLLVGENSTGKTSFLAAVQAVWDAAHGSGAPDFRKAPYDLGAFPEILYSRGGRSTSAISFEIGFTELMLGNRVVDFEVTFESRDAAPAPTKIVWREGAVAVSVVYHRSDHETSQIFLSLLTALGSVRLSLNTGCLRDPGSPEFSLVFTTPRRTTIR